MVCLTSQNQELGSLHLKESFWGDLAGKMQLAWKFWEADSERARDSYLRLAWRERCEPKARRDYRNGCYLRSFSTRLRTVRVRIARSRERAFLRQSIEAIHGRAEEVHDLNPFRGGSPRRRWAVSWRPSPAEPVSAQTLETNLRLRSGELARGTLLNPQKRRPVRRNRNGVFRPLQL